MPEQYFLMQSGPHYIEFMLSFNSQFFSVVTYLILPSRIYDLSKKDWSGAAKGEHVKTKPMSSLF